MIKIFKKKNMSTIRFFGEKGLSCSFFKNTDGTAIIFATPNGYIAAGIDKHKFFYWPWTNKKMVLK